MHFTICIDSTFLLSAQWMGTCEEKGKEELCVSVTWRVFPIVLSPLPPPGTGLRAADKPAVFAMPRGNVKAFQQKVQTLGQSVLLMTILCPKRGWMVQRNQRIREC